MNENVWPLILLGGGLLAFLLVVPFLSKNYSLNNFKSKTVGDGQHGTARWATPREIHTTYHVVPFRPRRWRKGEDLPRCRASSSAAWAAESAELKKARFHRPLTSCWRGSAVLQQGKKKSESRRKRKRQFPKSKMWWKISRMSVRWWTAMISTAL